MWKCLDHPNIVAFKGVTLDPLQLVSEWMSGGELRKHLEEHRDVDLVNLVGPILTHFHIASPSFQLLDIAEGLAYLHSSDIIHGDLKGVRVITHIGTSIFTEMGTAKHHGGRVRTRTDHGLWFREHRPGSKLGGEHL